MYGVIDSEIRCEKDADNVTPRPPKCIDDVRAVAESRLTAITEWM